MQVSIQGIEETVEVLNSLQKPKKIQLRGSDGRLYTMLCKPKDDLRKDNRLMEFTGIVNRCLKRDADSRRRELHIRTFTVTPLNEECGLLEWVENTAGLRPILMKIYKEKGIYMSGQVGLRFREILCCVLISVNDEDIRHLVNFSCISLNVKLFIEWIFGFCQLLLGLYINFIFFLYIYILYIFSSDATV